MRTILCRSSLHKHELFGLCGFTLALFFFTAPVLALSQAEKDAAGDACVDAFNACDAKCDKKWDPSRFRPGTSADLYGAKLECRASCTSRLNKCVKDIAVKAPNRGQGSSGGGGASR